MTDVWDPLNTKPRSNGNLNFSIGDRERCSRTQRVLGYGKVKSRFGGTQISSLGEWWSHFPN